MYPSGHVAVSLGVGIGVWAGTGNPQTLGVAVAAGVLWDADHLVDLYYRVARRDLARVIVPLHSWEVAVGLLVGAAALGWNPLALAFVLAVWGHILADQLTNNVYASTYFLSYRAWKGFYAPQILRRSYGDSAEALRWNPRRLWPLFAVLHLLHLVRLSESLSALADTDPAWLPEEHRPGR